MGFYTKLDTEDEYVKLQKILMIMGYRYPSGTNEINRLGRILIIIYPHNVNRYSKLGLMWDISEESYNYIDSDISGKLDLKTSDVASDEDTFIRLDREAFLKKAKELYDISKASRLNEC